MAVCFSCRSFSPGRARRKVANDATDYFKGRQSRGGVGIPWRDRRRPTRRALAALLFFLWSPFARHRDGSASGSAGCPACSGGGIGGQRRASRTESAASYVALFRRLQNENRGWAPDRAGRRLFPQSVPRDRLKYAPSRLARLRAPRKPLISTRRPDRLRWKFS